MKKALLQIRLQWGLFYFCYNPYMIEIPDCFYRISVKALVLNEARDKFLICKKETGVWELPGGGLDWGMTPQEDLPREIEEEMNIKTTHIATHPSYFITGQTLRSKTWIANVIYETTLEHLDFTPSDECIEIRFINKDNVADLTLFPAITTLLNQFHPENHKK
jgi:8-oxo-dGTP diphosphatase